MKCRAFKIQFQKELPHDHKLCFQDSLKTLKLTLVKLSYKEWKIVHGDGSLTTWGMFEESLNMFRVHCRALDKHTCNMICRSYSLSLKQLFLDEKKYFVRWKPNLQGNLVKELITLDEVVSK